LRQPDGRCSVFPGHAWLVVGIRRLPDAKKQGGIMNMQLKPLWLSLFIAANAFALHANAAEENVQYKDPPRWQVEDRTPQARFQSMKKENTNAYAQALNDCRALRGPAAGDCRKEARMNFDRDMQRAREMTSRR
jgi:hypothetical protein